MVLKRNKRALEDGKSCQPVKCHRQSEYSLGQTSGIGEIVPNNIYSKMHLQEFAQPNGMEIFCGDKLLISSREINLSNGIIFNDGIDLSERDEAHQKQVEVVKTGKDGSVTTGLVHSQNSVCDHKQEQCIDSQVSLASKEMAEDVLTDGTIQDSNLCEDNFQKPQGSLHSEQKAKDIETCMSVSSIDNGRLSSRVSNDVDFDMVSASSPSSKDMLCDTETVTRECEGSEKKHCSLPPLSVSDSGDFCSRTFVESDCNEEQFSHFESASCFGYYHCKKVSIGPEFQAEIPPWSSDVCVSNSDSSNLMLSQACHDDDRYPHRLLGNCVWPLAGSNSELQDHCVGQGKSTDCKCPDQNSIRCVKEHIEAEREKLKLKLGEAFSLLGFDDMGENVSEKWTRQEEETFWDIVSMNPVSLNKNFWNYLSGAFPSRSKEELVSYYFNVFVLRRRALQNRIDPENIDSDDDEEDWHGSEIGLSNRLGVIDEDDDSEAESDGSEGDDEVSESDEIPGATEEEDEVTAGYISEGHMTNRSFHKITFCDRENDAMDCQDEDIDDQMGGFALPFQHRLVQGDHSDLFVGQDLQNESCMSYEWNHGSKSSSLMRIRTTGIHSLQDEKFKEATSSDDSCKEERVDDLHYGNEVLCGDGKANGNLSRKDDFFVDGHPPSLLEPYDSKLWDIALVTRLKTDADRLVSTCSLIKELFGDETRDNDRNQI
ncbi:uncharacterized protein LOC131028765 [Cryptomeria japonica]|uniref:uncharacterized protein LOC131028765 n=1 Tax=Cryptomeria japonica TaxID=3369 RepID=UPI0027DA18E1|nr:uncharacterized protein LOC131028765 [Cryptomeria japonica]